MGVGIENTDKQTEILRRLSTSEKLSLAFGLYDLAFQRILGEAKRLHPELTPQELNDLAKQRLSR